jgi:hypothetical protein
MVTPELPDPTQGQVNNCLSFLLAGGHFNQGLLADGVLDLNASYDLRSGSSIQASRGANPKGTGTDSAGVQFRGFRDSPGNVR